MNFIRRVLKAPYRLLNLWRRAMEPAAPWLVLSAVRDLDAAIGPDARGFEWGSGRSTIYFAKRLKTLVSLDHDAAWHPRVQADLKAEGLDGKVELDLRPRREGAFDPETARPSGWLALGYVPRKPHFADYFDSILKYPDDHFDFVLVDGRARVACILNAIPKVAPGGLLVLDNSDRAEYAVVFPLLAAWTPRVFTDGESETRIFTKPAT